MDASLRSRAEQLASEMAGEARTIDDLNGLMRLMMKSALERMLNTELDVHLGRRKAPGAVDNDPSPSGATTTESAALPAAPAKRSTNHRNGHSQKTVQGDLGELTLTTPRDRQG